MEINHIILSQSNWFMLNISYKTTDINPPLPAPTCIIKHK